MADRGIIQQAEVEVEKESIKPGKQKYAWENDIRYIAIWRPTEDWNGFKWTANNEQVKTIMTWKTKVAPEGKTERKHERLIENL